MAFNLQSSMKTIAHRGGMKSEVQNTPEGVRLAARHGADFVELDVLRSAGGEFLCAHGLGRRTKLGECLAEIGGEMGLVAHLKGAFDDAELRRLVAEITRHLPLERVIFAAHGACMLRQLRHLFPNARLARFGLLPALVGLWKPLPWHCCMINQLVLTKGLVQALQHKGFEVMASCVWEFRSRRSVQALGVDGAFVNLYR